MPKGDNILFDICLTVDALRVNDDDASAVLGRLYF